MRNGRKRPPAFHNEDGVEWLISLTSLEPEKLSRERPGDLLNLGYDLERWLGTSYDPKLRGQIRSLLRRPALLRRLLSRVAGLVAAVADRGKFDYRYSDGHVEVDAGRVENDSGRLVSYRFTDLLDAVMHLAIHDLTRNDALRVRRCREKSCDQIFLASRRSQIYCSHRCANLPASRKYRAAHRPLRAQRERERYKSKVQARIGSRMIKVGRGTYGPKK